MGNSRTASLFSQFRLVLVLFAMADCCWAFPQNNPGQGNTATTRTNNPDGSSTVTTTTTYKDGSVTTETTYDKDGHDAGTVRTDVQTKDGETTTTITKYDGNGHETGKTITRTDKDGNTTVTNYDANGHETGTSTLPPFKFKPDWKLGLDYKVPPEWRYLPKPSTDNQNSASPTPPPAGTTRVTNGDGTTITTVTIFKDGWIITITKYDKDGHDAGTTRTDVQTKDGETTTTTTKWDGNGHETGKTIERVSADGSKTTITYDGNGHETGRTTTASHQLPDLPKSMADLLIRPVQSAAGKQSQTSPPQGSTTDSIVGVVTPAHRENNKPFSGSITTDPKQYQGVPGLQVQEVKLPLAIGGDGKATLQGVVVDTGNGVLQPAVGPIAFQIPISSQATTSLNGNPLTFFLPPGSPPSTREIRLQEDLVHPGTVIANSSYTYVGERNRLGQVAPITTSPICLPGHVGAVHGAGQFSGDAHKLHVSFGGEPVDSIAASTDGFFFQVPPTAHEGPAQLLFADQGPNGWFAAGTIIGVLHLHTGIANPNLHRGLRTTGTVGLTRGSYTGFKAPLPPQQLQNKIFYDPDLVGLADLQKQVPDFHLPETGQPGFILLSIQNHTPGIISIDGLKGTSRSWYLPEESLPFNTQLAIKAIADGGFDIGVIAQPFFPLLQLQEYRLPPELVHDLETPCPGCGH